MTASGNTFFFSWEVQLMEWLQTHLSSMWISIISFFSIFGEELILILIFGFLYWSYDKKLAKTVGLSVIMGLVWNTMAKNIALRRRPYFDQSAHTYTTSQPRVIPFPAVIPPMRLRCSPRWR